MTLPGVSLAGEMWMAGRLRKIGRSLGPADGLRALPLRNACHPERDDFHPGCCL